ncbi:MAG: ABC transporter ATP-binding protein/permease [Defluviitaleaceae bacterium]|nr:ABC transporter ATP-binding protein/permease [Defluviitaleaceae bacterium]
MKIFNLCKKHLIKHKTMLVIYLSISIFTGLFAMVNPFIIGDFIDSLIAGGNMDVVFRFSAIFAALNVARTVFGYITMILYTKIQSKAAHEFSQDVIEYLQKISLTFVNKRDTNYLSQVINGDTNMLIIFCISVVNNFILNAIYFVVPLIILVTLNFYVTAALLAFLFIYIFIYVKFKKPLFDRSMILRVAQNTFFAKLLEQLKLTKFIKIHAISGIFRKDMNKNFDNLLTETLKTQKLNFAYSSLDTAVTTVVQIVLFLLGGYLILAGSFTIGMFTIFTMYFNMILSAAKYFFDFGKNYQDNLVSYDRLNEILAAPLEINGEIELKTIEQIDIKNLAFSYNTENPIIKNLNFTFNKGKIYGILGQNGAGKSTFINLLMGMYIAEKTGEIYFNGILSENLNMHNLRKNLIGISEQETVILDGDIAYNATIEQSEQSEQSKQSADSESQNFEKYLKLLNMENLENLESSDNLSGGEKQKLAILRTLLKNPNLMIFDEPTSALDIESGKKFIQHLRDIKKDKIIVVITHDSGLVDKFDEIVRF